MAFCRDFSNRNFANFLDSSKNRGNAQENFMKISEHMYKSLLQPLKTAVLRHKSAHTTWLFSVYRFSRIFKSTLNLQEQRNKNRNIQP